MSAPRILLGVSGGIAAYKAPLMVRELVKRGCEVKVILTSNGARFVSPLALETVSGNHVYESMWSEKNPEIDHIEVATWADLLLVAPATANLIAKMAHGLADDLLLTTLLATRAPLLLAPGMNTGMWEAPATRQNIRTLRERGVELVGPEEGELACRVTGMGRMSQPHQIADRALALLSGRKDKWLTGKRVLISAGATREHIDPARFLSNPSTGRMGVALAEAAHALGAEVVLVHGHMDVPAPAQVKAVPVVSAAQMADAMVREARAAHIVIMAAAVADYTPEHPHAQKIKKGSGRPMTLALKPTLDILKHLVALRAGGEHEATLIGFAAETAHGDELTRLATEKLAQKGCDAIIANEIGTREGGFASTSNRVTVVTPAAPPQSLPTQSKMRLAGAILQALREQGLV